MHDQSINAEILSIGTELLLGQILDTNSQFLATELAGIGINCHFKSTVGDNPERIRSTFRHALRRSDLVISTGGLGPTADDLTHECLAKLMGCQMVFDQETLDHIESLFASRGIKMVDSNRKQAFRPDGSQILPNPTGTAPGIIWKLEEDALEAISLPDRQRPRYIMTFPGVPSEMKRMWLDYAKPYLIETFGESVVWSQELKHYGIGESALAEKYADLLEGNNPTVAPLAGAGECRLRVSARAASAAEAAKIAFPVIEKIKHESGYLCYGVDAASLESCVAELLVEKGLTVAAAESCSGGLLSKRLTDIPGSSAYLKLSLVTYANEAKQKLLQVDEQILNNHGAVSRECAIAMAEGARKLASCNIGISVTGIAGPAGGSPEKPVGLVYFALASSDEVYALMRNFPEQVGRDGIRQRAASEALNFLRLFLLDKSILQKYKCSK